MTAGRACTRQTVITDRTTCRACGRPLIAAYPDQTLHPDPCDPDPCGWTDEQLAEWGAAVDARKARERQGCTP